MLADRPPVAIRPGCILWCGTGVSPVRRDVSAGCSKGEFKLTASQIGTTRKVRTPWIALMSAVVMLVFGAAALAQVDVTVSSRETFVGVPVVLKVAIESTGVEPPPELPAIEGVSVRSRGGPMRSSQTTIINNVVQQRTTLTYEYDLTPMKEGRFTIPSFEVTAGGSIHRTQPITVVVSRTETDDLMFVEIQGDRKKLYVGESLKLTLRIWIKPFRDPQYGKLSEASMWSCVSKDKSEWGSFQEPLEQMLARRAAPRGRELLRKDSQGQERSYYLYEIERTIQVNRPGPVTATDINIVATYPTRLGRSNDLFSMGRLIMTGSLPVAAQATVEPLDVLPLPTEGRPSWFSGAVGRYTIKASAKPTEVAVGDPITLTLLVNGDGNLEELQPPPLNELPELTERFRIPDESLAGEITSAGKRFAVSIRAISDEVSFIPPIPFAFFDPRQERYITVHSEPIALEVAPAEKLASSQIVDAGGNRAPANSHLTASSGGILANYTGMHEVLKNQDLRWGPLTWVLLIIPPVGFVVSWTVRRWTERLRTDVGFARKRRARRAAVARLRASGTSPRDVAAAVTSAIGQYVADRCNLPSGGMTRAAVLEQLAARSLPADLVRQVDRLLEECESVHYAGSGTQSAAPLRDAALRCIDRLEREGVS